MTFFSDSTGVGFTSLPSDTYSFDSVFEPGDSATVDAGSQFRGWLKSASAGDGNITSDGPQSAGAGGLFAERPLDDPPVAQLEIQENSNSHQQLVTRQIDILVLELQRLETARAEQTNWVSKVVDNARELGGDIVSAGRRILGDQGAAEAQGYENHEQRNNEETINKLNLLKTAMLRDVNPITASVAEDRLIDLSDQFFAEATRVKQAQKSNDEWVNAVGKTAFGALRNTVTALTATTAAASAATAAAGGVGAATLNPFLAVGAGVAAASVAFTSTAAGVDMVLGDVEQSLVTAHRRLGGYDRYENQSLLASLIDPGPTNWSQAKDNLLRNAGSGLFNAFVARLATVLSGAGPVAGAAAGSSVSAAVDVVTTAHELAENTSLTAAQKKQAMREAYQSAGITIIVGTATAGATNVVANPASETAVDLAGGALEAAAHVVAAGGDPDAMKINVMSALVGSAMGHAQGAANPNRSTNRPQVETPARDVPLENLPAPRSLSEVSSQAAVTVVDQTQPSTTTTNTPDELSVGGGEQARPDIQTETAQVNSDGVQNESELSGQHPLADDKARGSSSEEETSAITDADTEPSGLSPDQHKVVSSEPVEAAVILSSPKSTADFIAKIDELEHVTIEAQVLDQRGQRQEAGRLVSDISIANYIGGLDHLPSNAKVLWIGSYSVVPKFQTQGIGTDLLAAALAYARKHNIDYVAGRDDRASWNNTPFTQNGFQDASGPITYPHSDQISIVRYRRVEPEAGSDGE